MEIRCDMQYIAIVVEFILNQGKVSDYTLKAKGKNLLLHNYKPPRLNLICKEHLKYTSDFFLKFNNASLNRGYMYNVQKFKRVSIQNITCQASLNSETSKNLNYNMQVKYIYESRNI